MCLTSDVGDDVAYVSLFNKPRNMTCRTESKFEVPNLKIQKAECKNSAPHAPSQRGFTLENSEFRNSRIRKSESCNSRFFFPKKKSEQTWNLHKLVNHVHYWGNAGAHTERRPTQVLIVAQVIGNFGLVLETTLFQYRRWGNFLECFWEKFGQFFGILFGENWATFWYTFVIKLGYFFLCHLVTLIVGDKRKFISWPQRKLKNTNFTENVTIKVGQGSNNSGGLLVMQ